MNSSTERFFKDVYYSSIGLRGLYELYEALVDLNNYRLRLNEGAPLGSPQREQELFRRLLDKATDAINNLVDRVTIQNEKIMQNRFEQVEELVIDVIEQQYKIASDSKSDNYGSIIRNCGQQLSNLICIVLRNSYQQAGITLYHINGKEVRLADFTVGFFMELAKEKKGINFKTLLVA